MIMTFGFILEVQIDEELRFRIEDTINKNLDKEICTDTHKIKFNSLEKKVSVSPLSDESPLRNKIIPAEVSYKAIDAMLNNDWDALSKDDIIYI